MGLFDFVREAGEKLFGTASAQAASAPDAAAANAAAATAIHDYICALELAPADPETARAAILDGTEVLYLARYDGVPKPALKRWREQLAVPVQR